MENIPVSTLRETLADILRALLTNPDEVFLVTQRDRPTAVLLSTNKFVEMGGVVDLEGDRDG